MYRHLLLFLALYHLFTGIQMFVMPQFFYDTVPGVQMLGPFNLHFIRDAGLSYAAAGLLLAWGWRHRLYTWSLAGTLWPLFHALLHLHMWLARGLPLDLVAAVNLIGIQLPAWGALLVALRLQRAAGRAPV